MAWPFSVKHKPHSLLPDMPVCVYVQEEAAQPLAAVAAVASHRLLSVATQTLGSQLTQRSANGDRGDDSLALALSALTALEALAAGSVPILDAPMAANVVQLTHQLLDKVHLLSGSRIILGIAKNCCLHWNHCGHLSVTEVRTCARDVARQAESQQSSMRIGPNGF